MSNSDLINTFYSALKDRDYNKMNSFYHENAVFEDEVFTLHQKEIKAMWHYLCERGTDLTVSYEVIESENEVVRGRWIAEYTFSITNNKIRNVIDSHFIIQNGKILKHTDSFSFWKWARQAFDITGWLLGWSPMLKKKVQVQAMKSLKAFIATHPEYQK